MARLPDPTANLTPEAREVYDELVSSRGALRGPYKALLNHPELARRVGDLGSFLRFGEGSLPGDVRELAILAVARRTRSGFEWVMHEPLALKEGVGSDIVDAIGNGRAPAGLNPLQANVLEAAGHVLDNRSIPEGLQNDLVERLGVKGVVELVVLTGFYQMIAGVISAFDVPLPEGSPAPLLRD